MLHKLAGFWCVVALVHDVMTADWTSVDKKVNDLIDDGHFSGCVLGIYSSNTTLYKKSYGTITPKWGLYAPPVTIDMKFDLNFLTQVIGINSVLMELIDDISIGLSDRVSKRLFDFDNNGKRYLTIQNLLIHNSGLQATFTDAFGNTPADLLKKIDTLKLEYKQETKFQYSELGYVVLGQMIAKTMNKTLDQALFDILLISGLRDTSYLPKGKPESIVPSGYNRGSTRGTSLNPIAHFLNSTAGNAGLFSTLQNIGTYMQLMLNRGKMPHASRIFSEDVIGNFTTKINVKGYNNTRALGWDTVPLKNPPCGSKFSQKSFGLSDPTGSYIWADKDKNVSIVLLANGQYPIGIKDHSIGQGQLSDIIMTVLGY